MPVGKVWQYPYFVRLFHSSTPLGSVELSKEWQRVHDWGKVRQYPYFVRLFHTSTPLRSVELSKEWQRVHDWGKVRQYPYFVGLFHTSTPLGSVELSKKWRNSGFHGQGRTWLQRKYKTSICTQAKMGVELAGKDNGKWDCDGAFRLPVCHWSIRC